MTKTHLRILMLNQALFSYSPNDLTPQMDSS